MRPATPSRGADKLALLRAAIRGIEQPAAVMDSRQAFVASGYGRLDQILGGGLARGALHDVHAAQAGDSAAAVGFALAWAARAHRQRKSPIVWISLDAALWENGAPYGPGLAAHGLDPDALILVRTACAQEALWALEETLRARAPAAVIGEFSGLPAAYDLTASRRLLLAAQAGQALGLLVFAGLGGSAAHATSAAATRFSVSAQPSDAEEEVPGRAAWRIDLMKNRAGRTGQFSVEWNHDGIVFAKLQSGRRTALLRPGLPHSVDGPAQTAKDSVRRAG